MKCTLAPGFNAISGSIKQKDGSKLVFRTYTKPSVNRKTKTETRVYFMPKRERATKPSVNELAQRQKFADAARYWRELSEEQKMRYAKEFSADKYKYRGKKYSMLRGYVIARFFASDIIENEG